MSGFDVDDSKAKEKIVKSEHSNEENGVTKEGKDDGNGKTKTPLNRSASCGSILQGNGINRIKNLSRRVSFPSDDKLISGYNEPKNPWEHAHDTTTEDLIQAYTQACQTWNVRPITKLLLQLQEIKDFTVRANSLTLKGEKLEMRVVETLESIFKRVQFITIDLEATSLDEEAGASLFDMIEYYESAVNVLVGFNKNLGNRGWQAAAHMMRKMSCLRLFDGHSVPISIQASPFLARALRLSNTIVTLHLENAMMSGRPLLLVVTALRMNTTLRELFLADNRFGAMDALQLANLLKFNRILQLLDLRNNPIQDLGLGHLCAGLMAQTGSSGLNGPTGGLQTLVLWNNQITHEGMAKLAMALRHTVSLSTLNLGQNALGDDGMLRLKEGLLQNHSLLRLGLVGAKLTDEGAVAVAEYLAESPRIIRLDLRNNDVKVAGFMALSLAFKINNSLLRLDIDKPNKKDALKELAAKQESLFNDIVSYAARNKQAALEKAQAAAARQEEARRAAQRQETELRYMDMTNSSSSPTDSSEQSSVNNSNNQGPSKTQVTDEVQGSPVEKVTITPTVTNDADDAPEDSPEFLPRSSVSYHQVAPVMLSNSEIAKRAAAAARLQTLPEKKEDHTPSTNNRFQIEQVNKIVDDAYSEAKTAISSLNRHADGSSQVEVNKPNSEDSSSKPATEKAGNDISNLPPKSVQAFYGKAKTDLNVSLTTAKRQENLDNFAAKLTETVLQSTKNTTSPDSAPVDIVSEQSDSIVVEQSNGPEIIHENGAESKSTMHENHISTAASAMKQIDATPQEQASGDHHSLVKESINKDGATQNLTTETSDGKPLPSEDGFVNSFNAVEFQNKNGANAIFDQSPISENSREPSEQNVSTDKNQDKGKEPATVIKSMEVKLEEHPLEAENNSEKDETEPTIVNDDTKESDETAINDLVALATNSDDSLCHETEQEGLQNTVEGSPQNSEADCSKTEGMSPSSMQYENDSSSYATTDPVPEDSLDKDPTDASIPPGGSALLDVTKKVENMDEGGGNSEKSQHPSGSVDGSSSIPSESQDHDGELEDSVHEPTGNNSKEEHCTILDEESPGTDEENLRETSLLSEVNCEEDGDKSISESVSVDQTSGIESATEDNSVISGDLSPMDDRAMQLQAHNVNKDLLTPDSGVVNFMVNSSEGAMEADIKETSKHCNGASDDKEIDTTTPEQCENQPNDLKLQLKLALIEKSELKNSEFSQSDELDSDKIVTESPKLDISPCEVQVTHYDLNDFPS